MLFADDFAGANVSKEIVQKLIDVLYSYCSNGDYKLM